MATISQLNKFVESYKTADLELKRIQSAIAQASEIPRATKCAIEVRINGEVVLRTEMPLQTAAEYFNGRVAELQAEIDEMDEKLDKISVNGVAAVRT